MTPRKRKTDYPIAGRPPKDPNKKVGTPVRCLVTHNLAVALSEAAKMHGIPEPNIGLVPSDIVRLYLLRGLQSDGMLSADLAQDPTWNTLKEKGLA